AHYVAEGSPIDAEAALRGTSVYLADRVIPMLPHALSNGICSLNPGEDRLTLSCLMTIGGDGTVLSHEILPSVVRSKVRFTYGRVQEILDGVNTEESGRGPCEGESESEPEGGWRGYFHSMNRLRAILKEKRRAKGALEFDFPETKIRVDESGWPVYVGQYERNEATEIIEEFMILCNETVAEHFYWLEAPFVYRSHEKPDKIKAKSLAAAAKSMGFPIKTNANLSFALQKLLERVKGSQFEYILSQSILRSLPQARYSPAETSHFGLASEYYCHFTSPIRRYPDLLIHRIIKMHIAGFGEGEADRLNAALPEVCASCSQSERLAESLEREVTKLKKVQYMRGKEGSVYSGVVSGVVAWGVYVTLPDTVEGLVPAEKLRAAGYAFDKEAGAYVNSNKKTGRKMAPGGKHKVMLEEVDETNRELTFKLV
ncbi:MAG: RNB domain-containing ribonuclease, partial [Defluviitaleaceae bacterium]|nr:RNB domain-containing ribonuclease [Defluviitaleaceae bacterium]